MIFNYFTWEGEDIKQNLYRNIYKYFARIKKSSTFAAAFEYKSMFIELLND
jgi:hypothetical protein